MKSINKVLLIGAMLAGVYTSPIQAQLLVNRWSFNGNLLDSSGNGNNGTLTGSGNSYVAGVPGFGEQAIYLTAANLISTVSAANLPTAGNANWSMNFWLYLTNPPISLAYMAGFGATITGSGAPPNGTDRGLLAFGNPSAEGIYLWGKGADLASGAPYPLNQWVMVTIVHDGSANTTSFYTNDVNIMTGAETALVTIPSPYNQYIQVGYPGSAFTYAAGGFNGIIQEFTIWSGALSTAQIAGLYASNSVPLVPPSIVTEPIPVTQYAGEYASLSVTAGNIGPWTYQWVQNNNSLPGQTNATISFTPLIAANSGSYTVIVSNLYGSVTSSPSTLVTVLPVTNTTTALAAYWNFAEPNGLLVNDVSGNGNNGQMFGFVGDGSERVPGIIGQALHFRGATYEDYIQITNCNIVPPNTMTISGWMYVDTNVYYSSAAENFASIVKNWPGDANDDQVHFGLSGSSGEDSCYVGNTSGGTVGPVIENTALTLGQWIHVAFTADGANLNIYRNGVVSGAPVPYSGSLNTNIFTSGGIANTMGIGVKLGANGLPGPGLSGQFWQGSMDDLAIWSRALSPAEILSIYLAGEAGQAWTNAGTYTNAVFPITTYQPQPVTRYQGEYTAQFSVVAAGSGAVYYQWETNGVAVAGATNNVVTFPGPFTTPGAINVQVIVTDAGTTNIVTSTPVALTVLPTTNITTALAAYWNFAEPNGLVVDDVSGNGNNGQMFGFVGDGSERVPGKVGHALHFRGKVYGDYVQITNCNILPSSTMTISGWMYVDAMEDFASILKNWPAGAGSGDQYHFGADGVSGKLSCYVSDDTQTQIGPVIENMAMPIGQWIHVAFTADGANLNIYRNGALDATPVPYNGTLNTDVDLIDGVNSTTCLGTRLFYPNGLPGAGLDGQFWNGSMDDLAIWSRALSPAEILSIYLAGEAGQAWTNAGTYTNAVFPITTYQPQPVTRYQGEYTAQFSVVAAGSGAVYYQWATNGFAVPGATSNVLTLPGPFTTPGTMTVQVTVSDTGTTNIVTSSPVALTVLPVTSITNGLSAHWAFDETSGYTAFDSTTNGREGALISYYNDPAQWVSGQIGGALSFDGSSQFVWVTNYVEPTNNTLTLSAWVFAANESSVESIIDSYGQLPIGQFRFGLTNGTLTGGVISQGESWTAVTDNVPFPSNTWQHVALVADGANLFLYRNGIQVSSNTDPGTILCVSGVTNLIIGAQISDDGSDNDLNSTPGYWSGKIDDLGMWSRGLTPAEIHAIYVAGVADQPLDQAMEPLILSITQAGGKINLSWAAGTLQSANSLAGPWNPVSGATAPSYQITPDVSQQFYRIHP
jgi:hypothetical protein